MKKELGTEDVFKESMTNIFKIYWETECERK